MNQKKNVSEFIPRVLRYLAPYRLLAVVSILLTCLYSVTGLIAPWPMLLLVDNVLGGHPLPPFATNVLGELAQNRYALLVVIVVGGLLITFSTHLVSLLSSIINTKIEQGVIFDFRGDL